MRSLLIIAALPLAVAACQPASENGTAATPSAEAPLPAPTEPATPLPAPSASAPAAAAGIPTAMQGRWGMVPADCTSTRGDAKGLLTVGPDSLTFYESVARLGTATERSDTSLTADFAFTGEGMTWTRNETLAVSGGGKTLTRTERGGEEPGGPFTYTKCAA